MISYIIRRCLYAVPIILGVNIIIFFLFFYINSPDDMARKILGEKNITQEAIDRWKKEHNYHLPLFMNDQEKGVAKLSQTIFFQKSIGLLWFDFGTSDRNNVDIGYQIKRRIIPSLLIAIPTFLLGIMVEITFAMFLAFFRKTYLDYSGVIFCVIMMSISSLFYIIGGQYLFGKVLKLFPISGYDTGIQALKFVSLPVLIGIMAAIGGNIRFDRTIFLEEITKDYIRTARSKGLPQVVVLFKHCLKNALIPILTTVVMTIPFLFMGSLLMESFFAIPGLGSFTIDAIQAQDFAIVRSMVYLGSILYIAGLILTDISYTLVDPRIRFE
ncbi:MAG: ABC transporter permease [Deltaproteobacteria bacterium]|nr:ABC transporter permease [Deltaproteobacteria bacterium]